MLEWDPGAVVEGIIDLTNSDHGASDAPTGGADPLSRHASGAAGDADAEAFVARAAATVIASLEDDKAEEIVSIDVRGKSAMADVLIVASGRSQRHVGALADHVLQKLKQLGVAQVRVEGLAACDWVLVDTGDVIVHLFRPEVRSFYGIEKIWQTGAPPAPARLAVV